MPTIGDWEVASDAQEEWARLPQEIQEAFGEKLDAMVGQDHAVGHRHKLVISIAGAVYDLWACVDAPDPAKGGKCTVWVVSSEGA